MNIKTCVALTLLTVSVLMLTSTTLGAVFSVPQEITVSEISYQKKGETYSIQKVGTPWKIVIPKLDVDAHVQDVGISRKGNMAVPTNYHDVGWYRYGPKPGEWGSAVMAGHYDNGFGIGAVFRDLSDLHPGDMLYIDTGEGGQINFEVVEVNEYSYDNAPLELIFNRQDGAYLTLITCAGDWLSEKQLYEKRTVVFAKLI